MFFKGTSATVCVCVWFHTVCGKPYKCYWRELYMCSGPLSTFRQKLKGVHPSSVNFCRTLSTLAAWWSRLRSNKRSFRPARLASNIQNQVYTNLILNRTFLFQQNPFQCFCVYLVKTTHQKWNKELDLICWLEIKLQTPPRDNQAKFLKHFFQK